VRAVPESGNNGALLTTAQTSSPTSLGSANGQSSGANVPVHTARTPLTEMLRNPAHGVMVGLLAGGLIYFFWKWVSNQTRHSWGNPDWSHAYLVPLISMYLFWLSRDSFERAPRRVFLPGIIPVLLGAWCYVFFTVGVPNHFGQGLSFILTVFGIALLLLGPAAMRSLFLPISYLGFAVTLPDQVMIKLTFPLQLFAAEGGWVLLRMLGVQADLSGNIINITNPATLKTMPMSVAEACSGMRMVIAFVALGGAVALVATRMWWKRTMLLLLALPVAILLNVVRVAVLGVLMLYDGQLSQGEAHTFIGTLLLIPGFMLYMAIVWALHKAVPERVEAAA
jgi:exosortase